MGMSHDPRRTHALWWGHKMFKIPYKIYIFYEFVLLKLTLKKKNPVPYNKIFEKQWA
jgi:hypothetical protein